jgi:hypothetical protein
MARRRLNQTARAAADNSLLPLLNKETERTVRFVSEVVHRFQMELSKAQVHLEPEQIMSTIADIVYTANSRN